NTVRRQRLSTGQNKLVFLCINVVSNNVDVVVIPEALAQDFNERCLARTNWAADADAQRLSLGGCTRIKRPDRNNIGRREDTHNSNSTLRERRVGPILEHPIDVQVDVLVIKT